MPQLALKLSYTRAFLGDLKTPDNLVLPPSNARLLFWGGTSMWRNEPAEMTLLCGWIWGLISKCFQGLNDTQNCWILPWVVVLFCCCVIWGFAFYFESVSLCSSCWSETHYTAQTQWFSWLSLLSVGIVNHRHATTLTQAFYLPKPYLPGGCPDFHSF